MPENQTNPQGNRIRIRGKVRLVNRALAGALLLSAISAPVGWSVLQGHTAASSSKALLFVGLAAVAGAMLCAYWRLLDLWTEVAPARQRGKAAVWWLAVGAIFSLTSVLVAPFLLYLTEPDAAPSAAAVGITILAAIAAVHFAALRRAPTAPKPEPGTPRMSHTPTSSVTRPDDGSFTVQRAEWAIACSGGGIRSAAFCLGALQSLRKPGAGGSSLYERANAVYSVSGGGYIAAGMHVARFASPQARGEVFMPGSPEEDQLRRTSSYLFSTLKVRTLGVLSLLFGLVVNLLLLLAVIVLVSWWMAWWLREGPALQGFLTQEARFDLAETPWWVQWCWVVPLVGLVAFLVRKFWERLAHDTDRPDAGEHTTWVIPGRLTRILDAAAPALVWTGVGLVLMLLALPAGLATLSNAAVQNQPTELVARLITQAGFVAPEACRDGAEASFTAAKASAVQAGRDTFAYGACGQSASEVPLSVNTACLPPDPLTGETETIRCAGFGSAASGGGASGALALLITLAAIVRSMLGAQDVAGKGRLGASISWLRQRILPWVGTIIVIGTAAVLLLRLTRDLTLNPALYSQEELLYASAASLVAIKVLADATSSSLHPFYRQRLARTFFLQRDGTGLAQSMPDQQQLLVSATQPSSGPRLIMSAAANVNDEEYIPTQRECTPFRFSTGPVEQQGGPEIGFSDTWRLRGGLRPAAAFEAAADRYRREATLAAAVAISGAAVSPRAGRANRRSRPYRLLLALANARLGVWLPNPFWVSATGIGTSLAQRYGRLVTNRLVLFLRTFLDKPGPLRLVREAVGASSIYDQRVYVTDGGHYDNTALVEALRDRPHNLILIDASNDEEGTFKTLGEAIATARMDLGLEVSVKDLELLKSQKAEPAKRAWTTGIARPVDGAPVPPGATNIFLVKAIMFDGVSHDVSAYAAANPDFPRTSTGNQLYGEYAFEAYRKLGYSAMDACVNEYRLAASEAIGEVQPVEPVAAASTEEVRVVRQRDPRPARLVGPGRPLRPHALSVILRRTRHSTEVVFRAGEPDPDGSHIGGNEVTGGGA